jgi:hypothetical protein
MITAIFFSDEQLKLITKAAATLPSDGDLRRVLLERIASRLEMRTHFTDADLEAAVQAVLAELRPKSAREAYLAEISRNPKWRAASDTGWITGILGHRAKP